MRCSSYIIGLALLPTVLSRAAYAQNGVLKGTVHDRRGEQVAGVLVQLECDGTTMTAVTDAQGTYRVENVPVGKCVVRASVNGMREAPQTIAIEAENSTTLPILVESRSPGSFDPAAGGRARLSLWTNDVPHSSSRNIRPNGLLLNQQQLLEKHVGFSTFLNSNNSLTDHASRLLGSTWELRSAVTYEPSARLRVTAGVVARRGYSTPLYAVRPLGSDYSIPHLGTSIFDSFNQPTAWDSELRVETTIKSTGSVHVHFVGEALNILNMNGSATAPGTSPTPSNTLPTLTSRSFRFGLVFTF